MTASKVLISIMPSNSIFDTIFIVRRRIEEARSLVQTVIRSNNQGGSSWQVRK